MKKTLILLGLFLILGGGSYYMLTTQDANSTTSNRADGDFAIENVDEIQKIFIADRQNYRVLLERKKGHWLYNKKYRAKHTAMDDLLVTLKNVKMKYTTPRGAEENMRRNLATSGIKVEIYGKNDKMLKTYYVGGATANSLGTYMIMEGATEPYIVHDPMFVGMLRGKYLKQPDDWKDLILFGDAVEDIKSVSVEYPKQRNKSFKIEKINEGKYDVKPFHDGVPIITKPVLRAAVEKYLEGYSVLHAEAFQNDKTGKDSIAASVPFVTLSVTNDDGETNTAKLFPIIQKDEFGNPINRVNEGIKSADAISRYFVDYSDGSFRLVQHRVFERVFWGYDYFF